MKKYYGHDQKSDNMLTNVDNPKWFLYSKVVKRSNHQSMFILKTYFQLIRNVNSLAMPSLLIQTLVMVLLLNRKSSVDHNPNPMLTIGLG